MISSNQTFRRLQSDQAGPNRQINTNISQANLPIYKMAKKNNIHQNETENKFPMHPISRPKSHQRNRQQTYNN